MHGVSTRAVDDLVEAMGVDAGISKSEVSRICAGLDEIVGAFRTRTLGHIEFPYVYLGRDLPARAQRHRPGGVHGRRGRHRHHRRRLPGDPRPRRRRQRGRDVLAGFLTGAQEARPGRGAAGDLRPARRPGRGAASAASRAPGTNAAGCTSPATCSPTSPRHKADMVAGGVPHHLRPARRRQPSHAAWDEVRDQLAESFPKIGPLMDDAKAEVLAFTAFPRAHWRKIWSHQPARADQQGDQTPLPRRRHLPQRRRRHPPRRRRPGRHARRMASRRPPLPLRKLHGAALPRPRY